MTDTALMRKSVNTRRLGGIQAPIHHKNDRQSLQQIELSFSLLTGE